MWPRPWPQIILKRGLITKARARSHTVMEKACRAPLSCLRPNSEVKELMWALFEKLSLGAGSSIGLVQTETSNLPMMAVWQRLKQMTVRSWKLFDSERLFPHWKVIKAGWYGYRRIRIQKKTAFQHLAGERDSREHWTTVPRRQLSGEKVDPRTYEL